MSGLTTITNEQDADAMTNSYFSAMSSAATTDEIVNSWFKYPGQNGEIHRPQGFKIGLPDFLILSSGAGFTHLDVCFGLNKDPDNVTRFKLLIRMVNEAGSLRSRYHCLTDPIIDNSQLQLHTVPVNQAIYNQVPKLNYELWTKNWKMNNPNIPKKSLQIITYDAATEIYTETPIRKYRFQLQDILNTFYPITIGEEGRPGKEPELYVYFACHSANFYENNTQAWGEFDKIGIMFAMTELNAEGDRVLISSCYDFSAPCPPTCPIG